MITSESCDPPEENRLTDCERYCSLLTENALDIITILEPDGIIKYQSPSITGILGYQQDELAGLNAFDFIYPEELLIVKSTIEQIMTLGRPQQIEFRFRHKNGSWIYLESIGNRKKYCQTATELIVTSRDISQRKLLEEQLQFRTFYDTLTGLPNRTLLVEHIKNSFGHVHRNSRYLFAILMIGLDRFKNINDSLGYATGDNILQLIAQRINNCTRTGDMVSRLGEDKFALLLDDISDGYDAIKIANRIREALRLAFKVNAQDVFISATIGIALATPDYHTAEDLLRDAEMAMHAAKQSHRGGFEFFRSEMLETALQRVKLETDLCRAIRHDQFILHYLPILSLENGKIVGLEALVRWQHPTRGLIYPDSFIAVAEEANLISLLGEWVLRTACSQLKEWHRQGFDDLRIAVNFSAQQFQKQDICHLIKNVLLDHQLSPEFLEMEITESIAMSNSLQTHKDLTNLRNLGIKISIDDFGTGYSSLSYLKRLPSHVLKIDRSFVQEIMTNPDDKIIVNTVVVMAHSLGLKVLAEGVETAEQLLLLKSLGCNEMQGFWFSPPKPAADITSLLTDAQPLNFDNILKTSTP